jgi:transcriptional regulator GlxA family with amidase domain
LALPNTFMKQRLRCACRGPGTTFEFALALVKLLYGEEKMQEVAGPMVLPDGFDKAL